MTRNRLLRWATLAAVLPLAGCLHAKKRPDPPGPPDIPIVAAEVYTLACPDVVEIVFTDRPDLGQMAPIGPDGCIKVGRLGEFHVEGDTVAEAAEQIAERAGLPPNRVRVAPVAYSSRQVFLFGQVQGGPRAVEYRGPETVLDLLKRAGGLSAEAAPDEVYVVRALLGEGIPAEVLTVDLDAIQHRNDQRTNLRVQPLDEIYVGEKPRSHISKAMPAFLRPFYDSLVDLIPQRHTPAPEEPKPAK